MASGSSTDETGPPHRIPDSPFRPFARHSHGHHDGSTRNGRSPIQGTAACSVRRPQGCGG
ncbi:hypothetical protein CN162_26070 [Sinorhizobium meliloti]|nr:hypothetical protein CN162_26070 [Sinorhizobium meliloti]